ncbi:hypothetical protein [Microcoleus sp. MON1_C1]
MGHSTGITIAFCDRLQLAQTQRCQSRTKELQEMTAFPIKLF